MAYIDKAFFDAYSPEAIDESDFVFLVMRASDVIDALTLDKIGGDTGLPLLPAKIQNQIKKATAAQVEMMQVQGGLDAVTGNSPGLQSASIGKFNYTVDSSKTVETINGIPVAPLVRVYLAPTGLLYRGMS